MSNAKSVPETAYSQFKLLKFDVMDIFLPGRNERLGPQTHFLKVNFLKINASDTSVIHRPVVEPQT